MHTTLHTPIIWCDFRKAHICKQESTKKQTKTKSIQSLVQESIEGVPDLTILDDIEQAQARQQRTIIEQREGQNYSQNIGD